MNYVYPFISTFLLIFLSELGDKTQLLVLSFSTKVKIRNILLGIAIGTFFSHGIAILFASKIASFNNMTFQYYLQIFTYATFVLLGIIGLLSINCLHINCITHLLLHLIFLLVKLVTKHF